MDAYVPTSKADRAKFVLSDQDILALARWACVIEDHYGYPMDMEWAKDGESGELFILQARPETVQSRKGASAFRSYRIKSKGRKTRLWPQHWGCHRIRACLPDR